MCGIAGWFSSAPLDNQVLPKLKQMAATIRYRGPDDERQIVLGHCAFAHQRLAIIDAATGQQPMLDRSNTVLITFNGEIYNYQELRRELQQQGISFQTNSDTEVILQLYIYKGIQSVARLRGMFAFAIWDENKKQGFLVRDALGIKPLFYQTTADNELLFGSEAKAIAAAYSAPMALDETTLHWVMNFRYIPDQKSMFKDIQQLPAGTILSWQPQGIMQFQSFSFRHTQQSNSLLEVLTDSVDKHLVADVEVGAYLSGGIDSATMVALALRTGQKPIKTFTINAGDDPNEASNAAITARYLGVENLQHELSHTGNRDNLQRLIWHLEVPKVNALQTSVLAHHAAQHVKVALSGLGGDELFLGYNIHKLFGSIKRYHKYSPTFLSKILHRFLPVIPWLTNSPWSELERSLRIAVETDNWPRIYGILRNVWDCSENRRLIYGPRMLDCDLPNAFTMIEASWPVEDDPVIALRNYEWQHKMVNDLLWQEDRCSMAEGLEVRVPFVDGALQQFVWPLNRTQLMSNNKAKGMLIDTVKPVLFEALFARKKSGFQVNSPHFFQTELSELADYYLSEEITKKFQLFNFKFIQQIRNYGTYKRYRWHFFILYLMLGTHIWMELFTQQSLSEAP